VEKGRRKRRKRTTLPWAELLRRVFLVDVLRCPCGGTRKVVAFVKDPALAKATLKKLGIPFQPLVLAKGKDPPSQDHFDLGPAYDGADPSYPD
jgi:hypothetical protein